MKSTISEISYPRVIDLQAITVKQRLKKAATVISGGNRSRDVTFFDDDQFLISYPRSGNTWLRFLLANLLAKEVSFSNIEEIIPDIYVHRDWHLRKVLHPRILKSHEAFDARCHKVVYIVRDPRDVAVSYYHFQRKVREIPDSLSLAEYVRMFVTEGFSYFGSWGENVGSWLGARGNSSDFLLLKYEEMMTDTESCLRQVADFLNIDSSEERIKAAVSSSSADSMRSLEAKDSGNWATVKGSRQDIPFVRSAKSGGWQEEMDEASQQLIAKTWPDLIERLGYGHR